MSIRRLLLAAALTSASVAAAHREDYLDETLVFQTIERHELEPEGWLDVGAARGVRVDTVRGHLALEYGITDHWMVDTRWTVEHVAGAGTRFGGGRVESRARLKEEGEWPVDIAGSLEVNGGREAGREIAWAAEPRLVLSRDAGAFNVTANAAVEVPFADGRAGTRFALGLRYGSTARVRFGAEGQWAPAGSSGSVFPQAWVVLWDEGTLKFGYSRGLGRNEESFGRIVIEAGL